MVLGGSAVQGRTRGLPGQSAFCQWALSAMSIEMSGKVRLTWFPAAHQMLRSNAIRSEPSR